MLVNPDDVPRCYSDAQAFMSDVVLQYQLTTRCMLPATVRFDVTETEMVNDMRVRCDRRMALPRRNRVTELLLAAAKLRLGLREDVRIKVFGKLNSITLTICMAVTESLSERAQERRRRFRSDLQTSSAEFFSV